MKLNEYIKMWDNYFAESLKGENHIPEDLLLKKYYDSYSVCKGKAKKEVYYIPEPFLGDAATAKAVIINTNPGGVLEFQNWDNGKFTADMLKELNEGNNNIYSEWAKKFIYLKDESYSPESKKNGKDFWQKRLNYINAVIDDEITEEDIFAFEIYPWHSKNFNGKKMKDKSSALKEFILEPIMDMKDVKYVFFLRKPAVEAMKESQIEFEDIKYNWESKTLKVSIANYKGKIFIGTINNQSGYPKLDGKDINYLKEIIHLYESR